MRLTRKLVIALIIPIVLIVGGAGVVTVRREIALLAEDSQEDAALLGGVLARVVADTLRSGGEPAMRALLADPSLHTHALDVGVLHLDAPRPARDVTAAMLDAARRGEQVSRRTNATSNPSIVTSIVTLVPVPSAWRPPNTAIVLRETPRRQARHVRGLAWTTLLSGLFLLVSAAIASALVGYRFVGKPVSLLVQHARRIGDGELGARLELAQHDELGWLAAELSAMSARLRAASEQARSAVDARIAAIEQLRHADRLATVGRLASGVAHELGTPLNVVSGRSQMIADGELVGAEVVDSARIIHEQAERMAGIVRQLLDFARTRSVAPAAVPLRGLSERARVLVDAIARRRGVALDVKVPDDVVALADDGQLQQALLNLIVNAIQATAPGGHVVVEGDTVERAAPATGHRRWARLRVVDDGTGMDPETLGRIFEPFFTTKPIGEGTGLGLSVTFGIARDCGGWIDVQSEPGRGSTFAMYLPAA